ncbi:hypothetical protein [Nocardia sp. NPDC127526]|uniref:hypothetical protein n=1 Tax=Nocardia sp. NPDC127526 TaxID=3345393 RepID=UPI0036252B90
MRFDPIILPLRDRLWGEHDRRHAAEALAVRYEREDRTAESKDLVPSDGDLLEFSDGNVHRFAGIGLAGNFLIAPCHLADPIRGAFQLVYDGDLVYVGEVFDTDDFDEMTVVDTGLRRPAWVWTYHLGGQDGEKTAFTVPVRVWKTDVPAPDSSAPFAAVTAALVDYNGW